MNPTMHLQSDRGFVLSSRLSRREKQGGRVEKAGSESFGLAQDTLR